MPRAITPDDFTKDGARRAGLIHLSIVYVVWAARTLRFDLPCACSSPARSFSSGQDVAARGVDSRAAAVTLAAAGLLMWPLANGLVNWAERRADSGYAALLVDALPVWPAELEAMIDRRRPTLRLALSLSSGSAAWYSSLRRV